ncbi:histidine phosphatase family protein [Lacimicrobium sp. SS2-24]|uniref:histidine phosphatase family protein n=1 Tax=Lacimicrobium sp. SS2-24 TaxID=2005569 RepID=UPI000B4AF7AC|nr:histidine phosphatase family protein [Lacimicrobium sp. SS2-24]
MQKLYLLRHGQAGFSQADYDALSETGYRQAWRLGQFLRENGVRFSPEQIVCGAMQRHRQTLDALWQGLHHQALNPAENTISTQVTRSRDWNEYDHHNILAALDPAFATPDGLRRYLMQQQDPKSAFLHAFDEAIKRWTAAGEDNLYHESWQGFCDRVQRGLRQATGTKHSSVLVVTSGGPIAVLAQRLMGAPQEAFLNTNWVLANCGLSRILNGRNGLRLSTLNDYTAFEATPELITYK